MGDWAAFTSECGALVGTLQMDSTACLAIVVPVGSVLVELDDPKSALLGNLLTLQGSQLNKLIKYLPLGLPGKRLLAKQC